MHTVCVIIVCPLGVLITCCVHLVSSQHYEPLVTAVHCLPKKSLCRFVNSEEPLLLKAHMHGSKYGSHSACSGRVGWNAISFPLYSRTYNVYVPRGHYYTHDRCRKFACAT